MHQIDLFGTLNPLADTKWDSFFNSLPESPGVYEFLGDKGELLYVGRAKSIKDSLLGYRKESAITKYKKIKKLLALVEKIQFHETLSEELAVIGESEKLQKLKPRFNLNPMLSENCFRLELRVLAADNKVEFYLKKNKEDCVTQAYKKYGSFRAVGNYEKTFTALKRILIYFFDETMSLHQKTLLVRSKIQASVKKFVIQNHMIIDFLKDMDKYFLGESKAPLLNQIQNRLELLEEDKKWFEFLIKDDLELINDFFDNTLQYHHKLCEYNDLDDHYVEADKLNELMLKFKGQ